MNLEYKLVAWVLKAKYTLQDKDQVKSQTGSDHLDHGVNKPKLTKKKRNQKTQKLQLQKLIL